MRALLIATVFLAATLAQAAHAACPPGMKDRTPGQVVLDLRAAIDAQDWDLVACNYGVNAFVIDDQGLMIGRAEIVAALQSLYELFGNVPVQVQEDNEFKNIVRSLWSLDGGWVIVPDGATTYVVNNGRVRKQTTHGLIEFTGPPPDGFFD